jgi:hypothetical protein
MFGKKKKQQKQIPLDVNNSVPYSQIRPPVNSPGQTPTTYNSGYHGNAQYGQQHPQQSFSHSYYQDSHYPQQYGQRPQSPGSNNQQYFPDNSGHQHITTHSRSQSQEHSPQSQSSYSFHDGTRYSSETSSVRSSGAFSSDLQHWVGSVFGGNKEPSKPSDAEIENLFLDLMV